MKISAERALRLAVTVADVVSAYLALSAQRANFAHDYTSVKGIRLTRILYHFYRFYASENYLFD